MCSNGGADHGEARPRARPGDVERLGQAIEELASAARDGEVTAQELASGLARVWTMVAELDPELARRLAGYDG
jgi:hypothetical protein